MADPPWDGGVHHTRFFHIENNLEWSMLTAGSKTQIRSTRRMFPHVFDMPMLVMAWHQKNMVPMLVTGIREQVLADMTDDDVAAEGFRDLGAFRDFWMGKTEQDAFRPLERVYVYEFAPFEGFGEGLGEEAVRNLLNTLYHI